MLKDWLMRKMVASKMKDVPKEQQEQMIALVQKNPEFFQKIAQEIQAKVSGGKDQMAATMEVMQAHQEELKQLMK